MDAAGRAGRVRRDGRRRPGRGRHHRSRRHDRARADARLGRLDPGAEGRRDGDPGRHRRQQGRPPAHRHDGARDPRRACRSAPQRAAGACRSSRPRPPAARASTSSSSSSTSTARTSRPRARWPSAGGATCATRSSRSPRRACGGAWRRGCARTPAFARAARRGRRAPAGSGQRRPDAAGEDRRRGLTVRRRWLMGRRAEAQGPRDVQLADDERVRRGCVAPGGHADVAHGPAAGVDRIAGTECSQALPVGRNGDLGAGAVDRAGLGLLTGLSRRRWRAPGGRSMATRPTGVGVPRSTVSRVPGPLGEPEVMTLPSTAASAGSAVAGADRADGTGPRRRSAPCRAGGWRAQRRAGGERAGPRATRR